MFGVPRLRGALIRRSQQGSEFSHSLGSRGIGRSRGGPQRVSDRGGARRPWRLVLPADDPARRDVTLHPGFQSSLRGSAFCWPAERRLSQRATTDLSRVGPTPRPLLPITTISRQFPRTAFPHQRPFKHNRCSALTQFRERRNCSEHAGPPDRARAPQVDGKSAIQDARCTHSWVVVGLDASVGAEVSDSALGIDHSDLCDR
jgi:hypothetical protein